MRDLKDGWLLALFCVPLPVLFLVGMSDLPSQHGAFWRESAAFAVLTSFCLTVVVGMSRPAGWMAFFGIMALNYYLPHLGSTNLQIYFLVASYFTLFFSGGARLTLHKIAILALLSGTLLAIACLLDPSTGQKELTQAVLGWFLLVVILILTHGLTRFVQASWRRFRPGQA